jgi:hypothetical protein
VSGKVVYELSKKEQGTLSGIVSSINVLSALFQHHLKTIMTEQKIEASEHIVWSAEKMAFIKVPKNNQRSR